MGMSYSTPSPPPPSSPLPRVRSSPPPSPPPPPKRLTDKPWRQPSNWDEEFEQSLRKDIELIPERTFKPSIVLVGPVGAGKSSFINTILSIAQGRKVELATTQSRSKSCTTSLDKYTNKTLLQKFDLRDCMGLEQMKDDGLHINDVIALLKGHIKIGYGFNTRSPIQAESQYYRKSPTLENQANCVVFVVDSTTVRTSFPGAFVEKIKRVQDELKTLRIPRILVLTKADILCEEIQDDITNMFRSVIMEKTVKMASEVFDIPKASIHPVVNYEDSYFINWKQNMPVLLALSQATHYADDRITQNEQSHSE